MSKSTRKKFELPGQDFYMKIGTGSTSIKIGSTSQKIQTLNSGKSLHPESIRQIAHKLKVNNKAQTVFHDKTIVFTSDEEGNLTVSYKAKKYSMENPLEDELVVDLVDKIKDRLKRSRPTPKKRFLQYPSYMQRGEEGKQDLINDAKKTDKKIREKMIIDYKSHVEAMDRNYRAIASQPVEDDEELRMNREYALENIAWGSQWLSDVISSLEEIS